MAKLIVLVIGFIIYVIFQLIIAAIKTSVKAGKEAYYAYESGEGIDRFIKGIQEDTPHAIVGMLTKIAKADGFISPFEDIIIRHNIDNLIDALKNTGMTSSELKRYYDSLIDTYEDAKNNNYGISYYADKVSNKSNQDLMHVIIQQLVLIGFIDGNGLSSKKESMIYEAANILGVSSYYVDEMINTAEESSKESKKESSANFEKDPWEVLGVSQSATFEEVKRAYRELVKKFHPDNLQSKGLDDEFLQYANQRMQEINEAFEKLRRYYSNK